MKAREGLAADSGDSTVETEVIETRTSRLWLGEDGILRIANKAGCTQALEDIKENFAAIARITGGRRAPMLSDISRLKSITREARNFISGKDGAALTLAAALLVASPLSRAIGNFFLAISRPLFPTKLFTSEAEALDWLEGFVE